ncbi:basigin-like [Pipistrellus kuhlii]|uniref:basigin-like n=1 Tax=Pipistrellus kuhlii TaxID=59472 RepID=UPI00174EFCED|nr:basigin-like [Pipistrellus kuhlii]
MDMAAALLVVLVFTLLGIESGSGAGSNISTSIFDDGSKTLLTCTLNFSDTAILGHRWMKGDQLLREDSQPGLSTEYEVDPGERSGQYSCTFLSEPTGRTARMSVKVRPKVQAVTESVLGIEGERAVLECESRSFPPVTQWEWYKITDSGDLPLKNQSRKMFVVVSENGTELHIHKLNMKEDPGQYACYGTNSEGKVGAFITLRLRSRFTAFWPFLGVLTEVVVLVTVILAFEKCRKPDEVVREEDMGSAPPKGSGHLMNDKDKSDAN